MENKVEITYSYDRIYINMGFKRYEYPAPKLGLVVIKDLIKIPKSIILDTTIFGSIFGESEVLIDATKSKISRIEFL